MTPDIGERVERIKALLEKCIPYKERKEKIKLVKSFPNERGWYSWLINDWIPEQKDCDVLMLLFIELGFSSTAFVCTLIKGLDYLGTQKFKEDFL